MWKAALLAGALALGSGSVGLAAAEVLEASRLDEITAAGGRVERLEALIVALDRKVGLLQGRRQSLSDEGKAGTGRLDRRIETLLDRIAAIRDRLDEIGAGGDSGVSARAFVREDGLVREIPVPQGRDTISVTASSERGVAVVGGMVGFAGR